MTGENPQKKMKNGYRLIALVLMGAFCLGPVLPASWAHEATLTQKLHANGGWDLAPGYFTPASNYLLRAAGPFLKAGHFAAISACGFQLSKPSPARLIESASGKYHGAAPVNSPLKVRAPPLSLSDRSIQQRRSPVFTSPHSSILPLREGWASCGQAVNSGLLCRV